MSRPTATSGQAGALNDLLKAKTSEGAQEMSSPGDQHRAGAAVRVRAASFASPRGCRSTLTTSTTRLPTTRR